MYRINKLLPYLCMLIFIFYVLPLYICDTGSAIFILIIIMPIVSFLIALNYGIKNAFNWLYPLLVMTIFIPSIFIFYNISALIYTLIYGFCSLLGIFIGSKIQKR